MIEKFEEILKTKDLPNLKEIVYSRKFLSIKKILLSSKINFISLTRSTPTSNSKESIKCPSLKAWNLEPSNMLKISGKPQKKKRKDWKKSKREKLNRKIHQLSDDLQHINKIIIIYNWKWNKLWPIFSANTSQFRQKYQQILGAPFR